MLMANENTHDIDLSELDALRADTPDGLWNLFVKAVNIHADPANVAGGDSLKQTKLKDAIEQLVK